MCMCILYAYVQVENNVFRDVDVGVLVGGGREHRVLNNTFESCGTACIHLDNRGATIPLTLTLNPDPNPNPSSNPSANPNPKP